MRFFFPSMCANGWNPADLRGRSSDAPDPRRLTYRPTRSRRAPPAGTRSSPGRPAGRSAPCGPRWAGPGPSAPRRRYSHSRTRSGGMRGAGEGHTQHRQETFNPIRSLLHPQHASISPEGSRLSFCPRRPHLSIKEGVDLCLWLTTDFEREPQVMVFVRAHLPNDMHLLAKDLKGGK